MLPAEHVHLTVQQASHIAQQLVGAHRAIPVLVDQPFADLVDPL